MFFNPFSPNNSDQQPISPNNNTAWLNIPVMRMNEMIITNDEMSWCLNKIILSTSTIRNVWRTAWRIWICIIDIQIGALSRVNYCQKQEYFHSQTIHANGANSIVPKAFKHLSTNIKTRQLSQNIFRSVVGQTSVYLLAIMNCFKHRGETAKG